MSDDGVVLWIGVGIVLLIWISDFIVVGCRVLGVE